MALKTVFFICFFITFSARFVNTFSSSLPLFGNFQPLFLALELKFRQARPKPTPAHKLYSQLAEDRRITNFVLYLTLLGYKVCFIIIRTFSPKKAYFQAFFHKFSYQSIFRKVFLCHFFPNLKSASQPVNLFYYPQKLKKTHFSDLQDPKSPQNSVFCPK